MADPYNLLYKYMIFPIWGFIFALVSLIGFSFFYAINEYTAAVTWVLAISTITLVLITYMQSNKQYRKALIEKQLEEFYVPLIERLTYPLSPVNGVLTDNDGIPKLFKIIKLKEQINIVLRTKGYLSDISLYDKKSSTHYIFNGYTFGEFGGKVHLEKWFFDTNEEKDKWVILLKQLYKSYKNLVEDYYHISGRDIKIQALGIDPERAFETKPIDSKNWLG
jgi:ribosomal protein S8